MPTGIPYCDETWNVLAGCTKVGSGCTHCYAEQMARRLRGMGVRGYADVIGPHGSWSNKVVCLEHKLDIPLHWRKPRTIFVNSMSDTFHEDVPFEFVDRIFTTMDASQKHTYMLFTKRYKRALAYFTNLEITPNVHLFFSVSTQAELDEAVPILLQMPAAVRGLSLEPLLEEIEIPEQYLTGHPNLIQSLNMEPQDNWTLPRLQSVIVGCESGPNRRPCKLEWIRSIVEQCKDAGVCCYVKQLNIDGKVVTDPSKFPEDLRVRQYPGKD